MRSFGHQPTSVSPHWALFHTSLLALNLSGFRKILKPIQFGSVIFRWGDERFTFVYISTPIFSPCQGYSLRFNKFGGDRDRTVLGIAIAKLWGSRSPR